MSKTIQKEGIIRQLESQKPNSQVWAYARFQLNVMIIKKQIQNNVKKIMFMHALWNAFLTTINFYLSQLLKWKDASLNN